jgi:hypothetical protein
MDKNQLIQITEFLATCTMLPFQYLVEYYFFNRFLGFNKHWINYCLAALLLSISSFVLKDFLPEQITILLFNLLWLAVIYYLCQGTLFIKIYAVLIINTLSALIGISFLTFDFKVIPLIAQRNLSFEYHILNGFILNIFTDSIRIIILFLLLKLICSFLNFKDKPINFYASLYLIIPCSSIYLFAHLFYYIQQLYIENKIYSLPEIFPKLYYIIPFIGSSLILTIIIINYTFKKMLEGETEKERNLLLEQQFDLQLQYNKNTEIIYSGIKSVVHDTNNHIGCLKNLAASNNLEAVKTYLDNISSTISKLDFKLKTGNPVSDAVINEKYSLAKAQNIDFICDFILPDKCLLEPVDVCIILSNALDNAIEACNRIDDVLIPKTISLKSYNKNKYLIIEILNTTVDKLIYFEDKILSTKSVNRRYGIGLSNIEATVKKYNGIMDIIEEKDNFKLSLMLKYF